ncbi:MAG TPA: response regulator, partial [Chloroflexota bacterium]|nr:response regulator [Chloroflexota bacterium]
MQSPKERARALILVPDDRRRRQLRAALEEDGHDVVTARSGPSAAALLKDARRCPDVVVLDMRLPPRDGAAFAEAYRRAPAPHPPIILVPTEDQAVPPVRPEELEELPDDLLDSMDSSDGALNGAALNLLRARVRLHGGQGAQRRRSTHRGRTPAIVAAAG